MRQLFRSYKERNPQVATRIQGFIPLDDKLYPPIQAADFAASTTLRFAMDWLKDPSAVTLTRLKETMSRITVWTEDFARQVLEVSSENGGQSTSTERLDQ
jgi:hypothetical protein